MAGAIQFVVQTLPRPAPCCPGQPSVLLGKMPTGRVPQQKTQALTGAGRTRRPINHVITAPYRSTSLAISPEIVLSPLHQR
jgi:hypothetical protein